MTSDERNMALAQRARERLIAALDRALKGAQDIDYDERAWPGGVAVTLRTLGTPVYAKVHVSWLYLDEELLRYDTTKDAVLDDCVRHAIRDLRAVAREGA